jgi:TPR repeat protein
MSNNIEMHDTKIVEAINKEHLKYNEYEEFSNFQEIGAESLGKVYRENLKNFYPQFSSNQKLNETSLTTNNSDSQEELSKLIQNFDKINIKEIGPMALSSEREKLLFEEGFNRIVDGINILIFKLLNKGIVWKLVSERVIEYFNDHSINLQEIYNWLLSNQYNSNSIFLLGYFVFYGIETNTDYKEAVNLFIRASEKSHTLAQIFAGDCYQYGYGTIINQKLAFECYKKAADKNFTYGQLKLGRFYNNGKFVYKNLKKAFYWFEKAADNGNIFAMHYLGNYYKKGEVVKKDKNKAFELFKQSAEGGHSSGITSLGYCYSNGIGTKIDKQKAFELYQKSAKLGSITGQFNLGNVYEHGDVVTQDIDKAIYWYKKSAEQGDQKAQKKLENLQKSQ